MGERRQSRIPTERSIVCHSPALEAPVTVFLRLSVQGSGSQFACSSTDRDTGDVRPTSYFSTGWFSLPLGTTVDNASHAQCVFSIFLLCALGAHLLFCPFPFLPVLQEKKWLCVPLCAFQPSTETPLRSSWR